MSQHKKAIILIAGDILVDYDAPYLAVVPKMAQQILGAQLGSFDEQIIREISCPGKDLKAILESGLYLLQQKPYGTGLIDTNGLLSQALAITEDQVNGFSFLKSIEEHFLSYCPAEMTESEKQDLLRYEKRSYLIDLALREKQEQLEDAISDYLQANGPFIPEGLQVLNQMLSQGWDVRVIDVADTKAGYPVTVSAEILARTELAQKNIRFISLRGIQGKDVKDLFPDLEYYREQDIMVLGNHTGLLSRSTGKDFLEIDRVFAEFHDHTRSGGAGFSRLKDAPYHVCMIDYNKSAKATYIPSTIKGDQVLKAKTPDDILKFVSLFMSGSLVRSFSSSKKAPAPAKSGTVIPFSPRKL